MADEKDALVAAAIEAAGEELRGRLEAFGCTPLGRLVRIGGRRLFLAKQEGRPVADEAVALVEDLPEIIANLQEEDDDDV